MAPTFSKKKAKYTYTERVLGALSDIQKDHRKHAVHMATLRAHVRKTADARKDKLGPQWTQWVSRTVQRLADDGILDTSDQHGNVSFTPQAKKTITAIRRESIPAGVAPSPNLEHKLWSDVTRRLSVVGVKRPRRRSSAVGSAGDDARPRKRVARKSFSNLTKAELEAELRATLQRLREAEEPELVDEQQLEELREELRSREQEVEELRDEVARLKDQSISQVRRVAIETPSRLFTPPPSDPSEPPSASTNRTLARPRPSTVGVTRTLSGSFISNLSKRPTPEPSEHEDDPEDIFDDDHDIQLTPASPRLNPGQGGFETPRASPVPDYNRCETPNMRIAPLAHSLSENVLTEPYLREQYQRLLAERDELRDAVASRDDRLAVLETNLQVRSDELKTSGLRRVELEEMLQLERERLQQVTATLHGSQQAMKADQEHLAYLETEHADLGGVVAQLESKVEMLNSHSCSLESDLAEARTIANDLRSTHVQSEAKLEKANAEIANLKMELRSVQDAAQVVKIAQEQCEVSLGDARSGLEQAKIALAANEDELTATKRALEVADTTRVSLSTQIEALEAALAVARDQSSALSLSNEQLERTVCKLQASVESLSADVSHAKGERASVTAELEASQDVINELRASHAQALSDASASDLAAAALKVTVSELEVTVDGLRSQQQQAAGEAADLRACLAREEASRRTAESELVASVEARDRLVAGVADKTAQLDATTDELRRANEAVDDGRRQLEALEERREKDVAALGAERSALEADLETARAEARALGMQVVELEAQVAGLSGRLSAVDAERDRACTSLEEARVRSERLERELSVAVDDVQDAEEEIEELRAAKAADEASVQSLKEGLARLRQLQMDAMNEVDNKMISTGAAPTPGHRRRSSILARNSVGRHV